MKKSILVILNIFFFTFLVCSDNKNKDGTIISGIKEYLNQKNKIEIKYDPYIIYNDTIDYIIFIKINDDTMKLCINHYIEKIDSNLNTVHCWPEIVNKNIKLPKWERKLTVPDGSLNIRIKKDRKWILNNFIKWVHKYYKVC